ncbi:hypothetical protein GCWU000325_02010 [Alloprevotella tannerae ATCC 51259]|uniref:Uncharacterized protein n=1 Tax=Alloprevotella tannerae ATCC 51259 TaxID=626522 RepID=C9LIF1_9BACT|nr:hypothetical protein GCWU000325_02010 [Alloprevotella tannerae ATCC 51259]
MCVHSFLKTFFFFLDRLLPANHRLLPAYHRLLPANNKSFGKMI